METPSIRIELPLVPSKKISANARTSRWDSSRTTKLHRRIAKETTEETLKTQPLTFPPPIRYDIEIYWGKGRLQCDTEGAITMCKPIVDGVVDALGISSDRHVHVGRVIQGRDAENVGWMAVVLTPDERDHSRPVRRKGELMPQFAGGE